MPRTATFTLTVLGLGLATTAAHANSGIVRTCTSPDGAAVSCPVDLVKGHDYLLLRHGDGTAGKVELVDPAGAVTVALDPQPLEGGVGQEFRAAFTATYRIRITPNGDGSELTYAELATDCRAGIKTQCLIAPGAKVSGTRTVVEDDWYRATLRRGRTYAFTGDGGYARLALRDRNGRVLAKAQSHTGAPGVIRYRAKTDGAYFFSISLGAGPYTLSMK
jgi:hypothetical protein